MMKLAIGALCLVAVMAMPPTPQEALAPTKDPAMAFMNLMKDMMVPPKDGGADPLVKDVMGMMSAMASSASAGSSSDGSASAAPADPMMSLLTAALSSAIAPPAKGSADSTDPMLKMVQTLAQTMAPQSKDGDESVDPMTRMATEGVHAMMDAMSPPSAHRDHEEHGAKRAADPMLPMIQIMTKSVQALLSDKSGDPIGTVLNVVLEEPSLSANPVIKAIKAATNDKTGDPLNAMIDSLMTSDEMRKDPYVLPILRIAKNVVNALPKDGDTSDPLISILNALAPAQPSKNPRVQAVLSSPDVPHDVAVAA